MMPVTVPMRIENFDGLRTVKRFPGGGHGLGLHQAEFQRSGR